MYIPSYGTKKYKFIAKEKFHIVFVTLSYLCEFLHIHDDDDFENILWQESEDQCFPYRRLVCFALKRSMEMKGELDDDF